MAFYIFIRHLWQRVLDARVPESDFSRFPEKGNYSPAFNRENKI
jgi:hypothetical protein